MKKISSTILGIVLLAWKVNSLELCIGNNLTTIRLDIVVAGKNSINWDF